MEKLKMKMITNEQGRKNPIFESEDIESILQWTITALYDGAVKRCKLKIEQYYIDGKEYCRIKATYSRLGVNYEELKDTYIIENWANDWGNYINVHKTLENNNIKVEANEE